MKWDWDYLWHFLAGGIFCYILTELTGWWWVPFPVVIFLLLSGFERERRQHPVGELSFHQTLEGGLWGFGGFAGAIIWWILYL